MEKYLKRVLTLVIAVVAYIPVSVYAIDISQADFDAAKENPGTPSNGVYVEATTTPTTGPATYKLEPGDYKFTSDVNLDDRVISLRNDSYNINLNGKTIEFDNEVAAFNVYNCDININGNGTIKSNGSILNFGIFEFTNSVVTIENGDFQGTIRINNYISTGNNSNRKSLLTINSGNIGALFVENSEVIINDAYIDSSVMEYIYPAITLESNAKLTINDGLFQGLNGISATNDTSTLTINKGCISGGSLGYGLLLTKATELSITSGEFYGGKGAIMILNGLDENFNDIISKGSKYSDELEIKRVELTGQTYALATQDEISVVKESEQIESIEFIDGTNQKVNIDKDTIITFRVNVPYEEFKKSGEVYVDDKLVDPKNYELEVGSTVINLKTDFIKDLTVAEHTFKVKYNGMEAGTKFKVEKNNLNPDTGDNLLFSVVFIMLFVTGLATLYTYKLKKINNEL